MENLQSKIQNINKLMIDAETVKITPLIEWGLMRMRQREASRGVRQNCEYI